MNGDPFYKSQIPSDRTLLAAKIVKGKFPDRSAFMPHVPKRVRTIIRTALKVNPAERYQTAREMADALARVPVSNDWEIKVAPSGATEWRVVRPGQPDLSVRLAPAGTGWSVALHTDRPTGTRAKDRKDWKDGLTHSDAHDHLRR